MTKKIWLAKYLLLLCATTPLTMIYAATPENPTELLYSQNVEGKNKYDFIQKKLYNEPLNNGKSRIGSAIKWAILLGGLSGAYYKFNCNAKNFDENVPLKDKFYQGSKWIPTIVIATIAAYALNRIFIHGPLCRRNASPDVLVDFVANWKKYRNSTPKSMHPYFDTLHTNYIKNPEAYEQELRTFALETLKEISPMVEANASHIASWWGLDNALTIFIHSGTLNNIVQFLNGCLKLWEHWGKLNK